MLDFQTEKRLKEYLNQLNLTILYVNDYIHKFAKTSYFLFKQLIKYKTDNKKVYLIKQIFQMLSTFYVVSNKHIEFGYDLKSNLQNQKLIFYKNTYALFCAQKDYKYQLLGYDFKNVLNLVLLEQSLKQFQISFAKQTCVHFSFYKDYFRFLKKTNWKLNKQTILVYLELYFKKIIIKFYGLKFQKANKLNIFHI